MADLFLTEHGSHIRLKGDNLEVYYDEKKIATVSLNHLDSIQIYGYIQFSTQVLYKVMRAGVEMAFHSQEGKLVGQVTPPLPRNLNLRVWQHRIQSNHEFKTGITKTLIRLKFQGGIRLLEEFAKNRDDLDISAPLAELRTWTDKLENAMDIPEILGLEGSFAMLYYRNYAKLFKNPDIFQGRSKRPPLDPANAVLSYSYTIMTNRIGSFLDGLGYDPFLGIYHTVDYGRMSLGCDLVEAIGKSPGRLWKASPIFRFRAKNPKPNAVQGNERKNQQNPYPRRRFRTNLSDPAGCGRPNHCDWTRGVVSTGYGFGSLDIENVCSFSIGNPCRNYEYSAYLQLRL